jgi:hypothetical protein
MERFQREKIISLVLWIVTRPVFPISFKQQRIQRKMLLEHRRQRRRRQVFFNSIQRKRKMACLLFAAVVNKPSKERSLWANERTVDINNDAINVWTDWDWRHHTRISKETF